MNKQLDYEVYLDRILGGWIGKSIGGIVGAPYECHKQFNKADINNLWPKTLYPNDDLDIQVVWLEALQEISIMPTPKELAKFWQKNCFYTCCEYGIFIDNLEHGIYPPLSGTWNNNFYYKSEGCPIRSEIWGFIAAGNPQLAMTYAGNDGCLDHGKESIEMEQFLSVAASLAFFHNDPVELFEECCKVVPKNNTGRILYMNVKELCSKYNDERELWLQLVRTYGVADGTNALINNAFAMMALIKGGNDFKEIMRLCVQIGWDVDCSCATAGALWGALHGSKALPQDWCEKMGKTLVCACDIKHKTAPLVDFAKETALIGLEVAQILNKNITFTNAPTVNVRPYPVKKFDITYTYTNDEPVLFVNKANSVEITVSNPFDEKFTGTLTLDAPKHTILSKNCFAVEIAPQSSAKVTVDVTLSEEVEYMPQNTLIKTNLKNNDKVVLEDQFGFHCVTQYQVYGPYWDMWDKEVEEICPYQNDEVTCNPGNLPDYSCDATNCHVRPYHSYLDEKALLERDLPEEFPMVIEKSVQYFSSRDLYSFDGASCCYLVREFVSDQREENVAFSFFADCPFECYLDGKLIKSSKVYSKMNSTYFSRCEVTLTGAKQRLVFKLATSMDKFNFQFKWVKGVPSFTSAHSPYYSKISYKVIR